MRQVNLFFSNSPLETEILAGKILNENPNIKLFFLDGNLGSGKTVFVKGIAKSLGINPKSIKSPSFVGMNVYPGLVHCDLYMKDLSLEEIMDQRNPSDVLCIEWGSKISEKLSDYPLEHLFIEISSQEEASLSREIKVLK